MKKRILLSCKKELLFKLFTSFFLCGLVLIIPIFWGKIINHLSNNTFNKAYGLVIILLVLSILYYVWSYLNQVSWYKYYNAIYAKLNSNIEKEKIVDVSAATYSNILNTDIDIVSTFVSNLITRIIQAIEFIFIFSYFFALNKFIFILTIVISMSLVMFMFISGKILQILNDRRKKILDKKILKDLKNYYDIKSNLLSRLFNKENKIYLSSNEDFNLYTSRLTYLCLAILELSRYGIIFYSVSLVSNNLLELGTLVLIYTYLGKIITNFETIGTINSEYRSFKVSMLRIKGISK